MTNWTDLSGSPFVTVSPIGSDQGKAPNNGANFGPDTLGTQTSGIQEALNSVQSAGGLIYCYAGSYSVNAPLNFTGSYQTLWFERGGSLTFANNIPENKPNWFDPNGNYTGMDSRLIHMGSPISSSSPVPYSHQSLIGNGLQINWGTNTAGSPPNNGISITVPGQASSPSYSGPGGQDYVVEDLVCTGKIYCTFTVVAENFSSSSTSPIVLTESQRTRFVRLSRLYATYSDDSNGNTLSAVLIRCSSNVLVEDCYIDCSALPSTVNVDSVNVTANIGEVQQVKIERSYFKANGVTGQCLEVQGGVQMPSSTVGTHDIQFVQCTFDSGATSGPGQPAGSGGPYLDDNNNYGGSGANAQLWNVEFIQCRWVYCEITFAPASILLTVGSSPYTYTNNTAFPQQINIIGGTVSAITVGGVSVPVSSPNRVLVRPGVAVVITYSVAPTLSWNAFGFIRFLGQIPPNGGTYLTGRGPNVGGSQIAVGSSPFTFQNSDPAIEKVVVQGGTVSQIQVNGNTTGLTSGVFDLWPGDSIQVTYSAAPTMYVQPK